MTIDAKLSILQGAVMRERNMLRTPVPTEYPMAKP